MIARLVRVGAPLSIAALLWSCAQTAIVPDTAVQVEYGTVEAIDLYRASDNQPISVGTVVGGIAGGVIGHQIGSGRGNTAATIAGAIGGAVVGNEIEKKQGQATRYRITVRLDSGSSLIVEETRELNLRVGDRVRVEDGHIYRI